MDHTAERITRLECRIDQLQASNRRLKTGVLIVGALFVLGTAIGATRLAPSGSGATPDNPLYVLPVDQNGNLCTRGGSVNVNTIVTDSRDGNSSYE